MKKTHALLGYGLLTPMVLLFLSSCGDNTPEAESHEHDELPESVSADPATELGETSGHKEVGNEEIDPDVRLLLEQSKAIAQPTNDPSNEAIHAPQEIFSPPAAITHPPSVADKEGALASLEAIGKSNQEQAIEITKLNGLVAAKDKRIHEYRILNEDLRTRIEELRQAAAAGTPLSWAGATDSVVQMKKELASLKNDFAMRTKDWHDSKEQVRILENKIKRMDHQLRGEDFSPLVTSPTAGIPGEEVGPVIQGDPVLPSGKLSPLKSYEETLRVITTGEPGSGRLEFQAAVTEASGKTREAFYTEFFITKNHLDDILKANDLKLNEYEGIGSYAELWARVRKNEYRYPGLQRRVREALLAATDADGGRRVRTDIDGASPIIDGLPAGFYYIIGTAPLGQVGVTWSLPVEIGSASDKRVALTLNNSSWSL